jgi:hypothetical protein
MATGRDGRSAECAECVGSGPWLSGIADPLDGSLGEILKLAGNLTDHLIGVQVCDIAVGGHLPANVLARERDLVAGRLETQVAKSWLMPLESYTYLAAS